MQTYYVAIGGIALLALFAVLLIILNARGQSVASGNEDSLENFRALLRDGIKYEDDFIENYHKVRLDHESMALFGDKRVDAEAIFGILVEESRGHKTLLAGVLSKMK